VVEAICRVAKERGEPADSPWVKAALKTMQDYGWVTEAELAKTLNAVNARLSPASEGVPTPARGIRKPK
jgi:hypothetical protein